MAFDFNDLVIFEMANNHQGSLSHGLKVVAEMAKIASRYNLKAAVKLQYRDLDTFVHPDYVSRKDVKHIPRFMDTRLKWDEFGTLVSSIKDQGMLGVVTAFDEPSVDMALNHGVDIMKVASCSCMDWPLLDVVARTGKPIICSTGGCRLSDVDKIVSFFEHRHVLDLGLLHCVGLYPTADKDQQLQFMRRMMMRYPFCSVGYSGHEAPSNLNVVLAAVAMGAKMLERHVGVPTEQVKLNNYSMSPAETEKWVEGILAARTLCGAGGADKQVTAEEVASLRSLQRGVYLKRDLEKGQPVSKGDVFFAMPCQDGQTTSGEFLDGMLASQTYRRGQPLQEARQHDPIRVMRSIVHEAKGILREARIAFGNEYAVELSHHYGLEQFRRFGAIIVDFINREYCKKLIVMLPGQQHPLHMHKVKEETFQVLYGDMDLVIDGEARTMRPGDMQLVRRGQYHSFSTKAGLVFEEISTTHIKGDSFYEDVRISSLDPAQRKTVLESF